MRLTTQFDSNENSWHHSWQGFKSSWESYWVVHFFGDAADLDQLVKYVSFLQLILFQI